MLRPIYYLLILTLIFFSCNRQESHSGTAKITIESTDIEAITKDSIIMPSDQDDPVKDLLTVEGTVQKPFDTLSLEFNLKSDKAPVEMLSNSLTISLYLQVQLIVVRP